MEVLLICSSLYTLISAEEWTERIIVLTSRLVQIEQRPKLQIYKVYSAINTCDIYLGPLKAVMLQQDFEIYVMYSITCNKSKLQTPSELVFSHVSLLTKGDMTCKHLF